MSDSQTLRILVITSRLLIFEKQILESRLSQQSFTTNNLGDWLIF
jgi:hypothetical protein